MLRYINKGSDRVVIPYKMEFSLNTRPQIKKAHQKTGVLFKLLELKKYIYSSGIINKATMLIILISGLIAGPAVSL